MLIRSVEENHVFCCFAMIVERSGHVSVLLNLQNLASQFRVQRNNNDGKQYYLEINF